MSSGRPEPQALSRRRRLAAALAAGAWLLAWRTTVLAGPVDDLFTAIRKDDGPAVERLMLLGVSPNASDPSLGPAVVFAAQDGSPAALRALMLSPALDLEARNAAGETALMHASARGDLDLVKRLVARRAQVNQPGWTALHYAAGNGHLAVVEFLLEEGAYIDAQSPNGTTPMMLAARQERATVAKYLVEQGADPTLRNQAGLDAADYFERNAEPRHAEWMRAQAREFRRRHGLR